jgi:hypothetical protein
MSTSILSDTRAESTADTVSSHRGRATASRTSAETLSARELLDVFERSSDLDALESLRARWVEIRGSERAAVELIKVMRTGSSRHRATAFFWLTGITSVTEAAVRVSLGHPHVRPYAVVWLREAGLPGPDPTPDEVRWLYVDLLAVALEDPERLAPSAFRMVAADGSVDEQVRDVADLWRCDHPQTLAVLDMVGRRHPEPGVAKAARKAAAKARSIRTP